MGFTLSVIAFYPGAMSFDSVLQLQQARAWHFDDAHPPLMAVLWGTMDRIVPGPFGMLLLHNAAFWAAAAVYWRTLRKKSVAWAIVLLAVLLLPQVWSILSVIWKDTGMGVALFLASALLYYARRTGSHITLACSVPALFYACAVRHNAVVAVLPLCLWSGFIAASSLPRLRRILIGLVYFLVLTVSVVALNKALVKGNKIYIEQALWLYDLAGISKRQNTPIFPPYVMASEHFSMERMVAAYSPRRVDFLISNFGRADIKPPLIQTRDPQQVAELRSVWVNAIARYPAAYLKHRTKVFLNLIGIEAEADYFLPYIVQTPDENPPPYRPARVSYALKSYISGRETFLLFRGWIWVMLSVFLLYQSARARLRGEMEAVFVLTSSGFLHCAGYFVYAPANDYRYIWWTVLAATIAAILSINGKMHSEPQIETNS